MRQAKGSNSRVCIQPETTYSDPPGIPDAQLLNVKTCGLRLLSNPVEDDTLRGNRNPTKPGRDVNDVSGPLVLMLQAYMASIWKAALGSCTTTGAGPAYVHTFNVGSSLPSLLVENGYPDLEVPKYLLYTGNKVARLGLSITPKGLQPVTVDLIGSKEIIAGAAFDITPTDFGYQPFSGLNLTTLEEGGAPLADILSLDSLSFDNGLDGDQYCLGGGGNRTDVPEGKLKVTGTLKARFTGVALYEKALAGTESSLRALFALGNGAGTAGNESTDIKLPELVYTPNSPVIEGPKGLLVGLGFVGYYDNSAEGSAVQVIVKNTQPTVA